MTRPRGEGVTDTYNRRLPRVDGRRDLLVEVDFTGWNTTFNKNVGYYLTMTGRTELSRVC